MIKLGVDFGDRENQKSFFKRKPFSLTWKDFYAKILDASEKSFSFRAFQHWYKGERLATLEIVRTICDLSNLDFSQLVYKLERRHWAKLKEEK